MWPRSRVTWSAMLITMLSGQAMALTEEERNTIAAHERVTRSVVLVVVRGVQTTDAEEREVMLTGSGFAVELGLVVTNYHVVETARRVEVVLQDGVRADAVLMGTAPDFDLALLRVPYDDSHLPPAPLGTAVGLRMGQKVLMVSHPLGLWHSLTAGTVSGLNREMPGLEFGAGLIQFDAPLNPGQSGGPLVDSEGRVVGVTTAKIGGAEGIGLAIPIDILVHVLPNLKEMGHAFRPRMGFTGVSVGPDLARLFDLPAPAGVLVERIEAGSIAERAGLRAGRRHVALGGREYVLGGDQIVAADGVPVSGSEDLLLRFMAARPGERMVLSVAREGGRRNVNLIIPEMKH